MKIDVIQLRGRWVSSQCDAALEYAVEAAREAGHDVFWPKDIFASALLCHARNMSLRRVRPDADFVLFIDDDMIPVQAAIVQLVERDVDAVSALCTTRSMPVRIAGRLWRDGDIIALESLGHGLIEGPFALGFGCVLVKGQALRDVQEMVSGAKDWLAINRGLFERIGAEPFKVMAEAELIAKQRYARRKKEGWLPVFQTGTDASGKPVGEDQWFSRLLHLAGRKTFIDSSVLVGHMGEFPYSPVQLGIDHPSKVRL